MSEERERFGQTTDDAPTSEIAEAYAWPPWEGAESGKSGRFDAVQPPNDDEEPRVSWLARLLGLKRRTLLEARQRRLERAIAEAPDAQVNYVLRGEVLLRLGKHRQAASDFEKALALADAAFTGSDWGLVSQTLTDRALMGLRRAGYTVRLKA